MNNLIYYISHRGLLNGPDKDMENTTWAIEKAIDYCNSVEVDIWVAGNRLYLGHDTPTYEITWDWLEKNQLHLWLHCKNIAAIETFNSWSDGRVRTPSGKRVYHYFWHQTDTLTITSKGFLWAFPGKQPIKNSIAVLPEMYNDNLSQCIGICTDYITKYKNNL